MSSYFPDQSSRQLSFQGATWKQPSARETETKVWICLPWWFQHCCFAPIFNCVVCRLLFYSFFFSGLFQIGVSMVFILAWFIMYGKCSITGAKHFCILLCLIGLLILWNTCCIINATYFQCAFDVKLNLFVQYKSAFDLNKGGQSKSNVWCWNARWRYKA